MKQQTQTTITSKMTRLDWVMLIPLLIMIFGVPSAFTSYTRSVFEINKLMVIRLSSLILGGLWLYQHLRERLRNKPSENTFTYKHFQWDKIGIEVGLIAWFVSSVISTIFSKNPLLSFHGSYDRWEGLYTTINYIFIVIAFSKLIHKKTQLHWILWGILLSTGLSGIYGVFQSLGINIFGISWSIDAARRVFANINNPVHYCAYVGMVIPIGIGLTLFISHRPNTIRWVSRFQLQLILFITTALLYYNQILSYSRATWLGFLTAITLFYGITTYQFNEKNQARFNTDIILTCLTIGVFYIYYIFRLHETNLYLSWLLPITMISFIALHMKISYSTPIRYIKTHINASIGCLIFMGITTLNVIYPILEANPLPLISTSCLSLAMIGILYLYSDPFKVILSKLITVLLFAQIQFCTTSINQALITATLTLCLYLVAIRSNDKLLKSNKKWLMAYLIMFSALLILPTLTTTIKTYLTNTSTTFKAINTINYKIDSYKNVAIEGTARTSMWKSAFPWIKDHFLIGSGLDTVKYMFPIYRRAEYGELEGGHNFTPDKLHNEYLNTFATKGIVGFIAYYIVFIGSWFLLCLNHLYTLRNNPYHLLLLSLMCGAVVYLGQVLFNFGVVATLFLFYVLVGVSLTIKRVSHDPN